MPPYFSLPLDYGSLHTATFLSRPNRFLVWCEHETWGPIRAFLPNPGRLSELLFPGVILHILDSGSDGGTRATRFTVVAVERDHVPVMLHTHWCNDIAHNLLGRRLIPGLEQAGIVRREISVGRSRFDFLLSDDDGSLYLEVKSCTLFGNGVAMFPDAVTERGRRHLLELADLADAGHRCFVLFLVHSGKVSCFMPDYHTDLAFSRTLLAVHDKVKIMALPLSWSGKLRYAPRKNLLEIPWEHIDAEAHDGGAYCAILHLEDSGALSIGGLGNLSFAPGYYLYVGSAMRGLDARMARHRRKRKRMHWHVDYLRDAATVINILPIRSSKRLECDIARDLHKIGSRFVPGFGCSDCACDSHLFVFQDNPLEHPWFHDWLQRWRMPLPA